MGALKNPSVWILVVTCAIPSISAQDKNKSEPEAATMKISRILFLGNSITLHPPKADIGWSSNWGMAASAQEKDYVHLLTARIGQETGVIPECKVENIVGFEREYGTFDIAPLVKRCAEFKPDTVVLAIGENVPKLAKEADKAKFKTAVSDLIRAIKKEGAPAIFVRSCFWADSVKDSNLREAAEEGGVILVDISGLSGEERNYARSERKFQNAGVAAHPGDQGMKAIADAIWKVIAAHRSVQKLRPSDKGTSEEQKGPGE